MKSVLLEGEASSSAATFARRAAMPTSLGRREFELLLDQANRRPSLG